MSITQSALEQFKQLPVLLSPGDCTGKTYIVTGANSGLGLDTAKHLVRCSAKYVILAVRNVAAGEKAKSDIEAATGRTGVTVVWHLDLGSNASVETFAEKATHDLERLDAVVENAAIALDQWAVKEGLETSFKVNVISTILLGVLLLPKLIESGRKYGFRPRLTFVVATLGFTAKDELQKCNDSKLFDGLNDQKRAIMDNRYSLTKLVEMYAVRQFAAAFPVERTGVIINMVHPGLCSTGLARDTRSSYRLMLSVARSMMARTAEEGSRTIMFGIVAEEGSHGKLLSACKIKDHWIPEWMTNENGELMQYKIWTELTEMMERIQAGCPSAATSLSKGV